MKIGMLRSRIEFQTEVVTENAQFMKDHVWTTQFTTWGNIAVNSGLQFTRGVSSEPSTSHTVTIRERLDVVRGMRIRSDGINYTINRILFDVPAKKKYLILHCEQEEVQT